MITPHSILIPSLISSLILISSCAHPLYDGPVEDLAEQQSVWQHLSVYSIYQDRVPPDAGHLTPKQMFDMIDDCMTVWISATQFTHGCYTEYVGGASGGTAGETGGGHDQQAQTVLIDITDNTVYLRLADFEFNTLDDFNRWRDYINRFDNVVIDLRGNGGGSLNVTDSIVGEFIPANAEYIRTRQRVYDSDARVGTTKEWSNSRNSKRSPRLTTQNIAVITNRFSASASELLAAALKDNETETRKIFLVGTTTYGKGIGQIIAPRMGRQTLRVTFLQIAGISQRTGDYHGKGIDPDPLPEDLIDRREEECLSVENESLCDPDLYAAVKLLEPEAAIEDIIAAAGKMRKSARRAQAAAEREIGAYVLLEMDALNKKN